MSFKILGEKSLSDIEYSPPTLAIMIPSLKKGGAEGQAVVLSKNIDRKKWRVILIVLSSYEHNLEFSDTVGDVDIFYIPKRGDLIKFLFEIKFILASQKVALVNAYLVTSQAYAFCARVLGWRGRLIFGVRDSLPIIRKKGIKDFFLDLIVFNPLFGPDLYIFNSTAGKINKGFFIKKKNAIVIYNAIDTQKFKPNLQSREHVLDGMSSYGNGLIIGLVANLNEHKDVATFVRAAQLAIEKDSSINFVIIGEHETKYGEIAKELIAKYELKKQFHFFGVRTDIEILLPGLDLLVSSSITEGFSNTIAEAMASGVPCVVTDVGDSSMIVNDTGYIVNEKDYIGIAEAIVSFETLTHEERASMGKAARKRIVENFSNEIALLKNNEVYEKITSK